MIERRRAPRYDVAAGELALLPAPTSVQILDISLGGALLQSPHHARVGGTGRLALTLEGQPFLAEVEIRRVEGDQNGNVCKLGVAFVELTTEHRQMVADFTRHRNG